MKTAEAELAEAQAPGSEDRLGAEARSFELGGRRGGCRGREGEASLVSFEVFGSLWWGVRRGA